ncbi:hypothetical protein, partial [Albimonas pacifica]|uniref:hypothetical protein n=1 Tax=Albimonas pacifica TaxID=1114924 RepID=UPI001C433E43
MIQRIPCGRIISLAFPSLFGQGEKDEPHLSQRPGGVETHRLDGVRPFGRTGSGGGFDRGAGVAFLEFDGAEI